ncbi:hypothetical protein HMPREF1980_02025 [Actinomyces sp. oral taxon 172 str. F0311]|nr:hypothetical protein HMPREF1980_02025 [Actinomyces sp. oral taxon 172 str. F0311]
MWVVECWLRLRVGVEVLGGERTSPSAVVESLGLGLCACW